jgi:hypothetical protein
MVSLMPWLGLTASLDVEEQKVAIPSHQVNSLVIIRTELTQL